MQTTTYQQSSNEDWDYLASFKKTFGSMISSRNLEIFTPIVELMTAPRGRVNDGSIDPPQAVWDFQYEQEPERPERSSTVDWDTFIGYVNDNENFVNGNYFPDYGKYTVYADMPVLPEGSVDWVRPQYPDYPLSVRQKLSSF